MASAILFSGVAMVGCKGDEEPQIKTAEVTISTEGGSYELSNGVQLVVPAGAVNAPEKVTVTYSEDLDESTGDLPSDVQAVVQFGPEGLTFEKPIQVTMPLTQSMKDASIDIFYWANETTNWYLTDIGSRDGDKVTFYVDHFSTYAAMTGGWSDLFNQMDNAVGSAESEEDISDAVKRFLKDLYDKQFEGYRFATRVPEGNIGAQACGIFGFWAEEKDGVTRQGGGRYKEKSKHNIITSIGYSDAYASSHLNRQSHISRTIELYSEPCLIDVKGDASPSTIEKGKKSTVTITASCGADAVAEQFIQLQYSPELSGDVVNKKADANGQITITVKGEEEGQGYVYAKAVNAADASLVTEIAIPVKVGDGENWRITMDVHIQCTSSFMESNTEGIYTENYKVEGGDQSIEYGYTEVLDLTISNPQKYDEYLVSKVTGKASVTNHRGEFKASFPDFSQSGKYTVMDIVSTASMSQSLSVSPQFIDLTDIPVCGTFYTNGKDKRLGIFVGYSDPEEAISVTAEEMIQMILDKAFLIPNITGSWTASDSDGHEENGTMLYGKVGLQDNEKGHNLSLCSAYGQIEGSELKEETVPFQFTKTDYSLPEIPIGSYVFGSMADVYAGIYPTMNWVGLANWTGKRHWTVSGTLKIENLTNKK